MKIQKITENLTTSQNFQHELNQEKNNNLYIAGQVSIVALQTILKSAKNCFIPSVEAAKDETPKCPPPMKYKDLPIYDCPHIRWKEYEEDKTKCVDRKVIHESLLPTVSDYRKQVAGMLQAFKTEMRNTYQEVSRDYRSVEKKMLEKARCPKNKDMCTGIVAASGLAGLKIGKTIPRRIFYSGILLFVSGSICFPEATDEATRTLLYMAGKAFVPIYNFYFGTDWVTRERVPCERDLPKIPPPTKLSPVCDSKKK